MDGYVDLAGSGQIRITTSADVERAISERAAQVPPTSAPRKAITASASKLRGRDKGEYAKRLSQPWQLRALSYYDQIGEINFTSKFLSRQISRVRFYPARKTQDGTVEEIKSGPAVEILNQIQDPGGGQSQLLYDFGRLMFLTGEGVLFGYEGGTRWKFLWKDEVKQLSDSEWVRLDYERKETNERGVAYRMWTPHPRHSDEADAPMRAVMDICEELIILTLSVRSTATTRMTHGILAIAQEISPNPSDYDGYEGDEDPEQNPFLADLMDHTTAQVENPGSPDATHPFVAEIPFDYMQGGIQWIKTHDPATDYMEKELRTEAIKRLSLSLDMSPEDLLGYTDANHWTSRSVQLDRWRMFGYNKAELWAVSVNDAYLRPKLEEEGEDPSDIIIAFDDSQVVISPDRTEDALKAHAQGIINGKAARAALGWKESDALEGDEKEEFFALKLRAPQLLDGEEMMLPARGPLPSQNGRNPEDGPAEPSANRGVSRQESMAASGKILGAAELALLRCRELAGVRIRHKCKDCAEGYPDAVVASVIGPDRVPDPLKMVKGGTDGFRTYLCASGMDDAQAAALCQVLEVFAAKTLYEERQPELPSGFIAQVEKAREVSRAVTA